MESCPSPPTQPPPQSRKVWEAPTASRGTPGYLSRSISGTRVPLSPPHPNSSRRPTGAVERQQEGGRMASHSRAPAVRASPFLPQIQASPSPILRKDSGLREPPNSRGSGVPAPTSPPDQGVRVLRSKKPASRPPFLLPRKPSVQVLSCRGPLPCVSALPTPRWDPRPAPSPSSQRRGVGSSRAAGPGGGGTHGSGADPGTRGLPPASAPAAGAEDGAGQTAGTGWTT